MFIFVDSSVLCTDYYMSGVNFELMKSSGSVVLPEIVIEETKNKYREMLESSLKKTNAGIKELQRLKIDIELLNNHTIDETVNKYSDFLEMFLIESGMTVAEPYPNTPHNIIVKRALERKKPFKNDGKNGYRDFIVWLTFLDMVKLISNKEPFVFLTLNANDFSDDKDENALHPDLLSDIDELHMENKDIIYYSSVKKFIDDVIIPRNANIEAEQEFISELLGNQERFVVPIEKFVQEKIMDISLCEYDVYVDGFNPVISEIYNAGIEEVCSASQTSSGNFLISLKVNIDCSIESYLLKTDLQTMSKKEIKRLNIINSDWDNTHISVEDFVVLEIDIDVLCVINEGLIKINAIEITEVSDGNCPYCPDYPDDEDDEDYD